MNILPEIRSCSEIYGHIVSPLFRVLMVAGVYILQITYTHSLTLLSG
jgi:hypothetical protein